MAAAETNDTRDYRKAALSIFDDHYDKLRLALKGCIESLASKAFAAKLISDEVLATKDFRRVFSEFKAGFDWAKNVLEIQARCQIFIGILEDIGGPAALASKHLNAELAATFSGM